MHPRSPARSRHASTPGTDPVAEGMIRHPSEVRGPSYGGSMRKLIAWVFMYSLDGLLADDGTEYWDYCFGLPADDAALAQQVALYESADIHIMGRTTYEGTSVAMQTAPDHAFAPVLNSAKKVVFSRTMQTADWANTTIASGDTLEEIEKLRQGGDGYIVVWGGIGLWRSLIEHDLIDEWKLDLHPYVAGEGTRLFDGYPKDYRLELISSIPLSNGTIELHYRGALVLAALHAIRMRCGVRVHVVDEPHGPAVEHLRLDQVEVELGTVAEQRQRCPTCR